MTTLAAGSSIRYLDYEPIPIAQAAARTVQDVLDRNGMELRELDGLIYAGLFRENLEPSTAAFTALELGAPRLKTLDVTTACSGMAHAVEVATGWLAANPSITNVALVSVDTPFRALDWDINSSEELTTKGAGLTIGAGASALIITRERPALGIQLREFVSYDDASYAPICKLPIGGLFTSDSNRLAKPTINPLLIHDPDEYWNNIYTYIVRTYERIEVVADCDDPGVMTLWDADVKADLGASIAAVCRHAGLPATGSDALAEKVSEKSSAGPYQRRYEYSNALQGIFKTDEFAAYYRRQAGHP